MWDDGRTRSGDSEEVIGEWLLGAARRYDDGVPACSKIFDRGREAVGRQGELVSKLQKIGWDGLKGRAGEWDKARLEAAAAPRAGVWLGAPPSRALDFRLTNSAVRSRVGRRLGCAICEERPCPFCLGSWTGTELMLNFVLQGGQNLLASHSSQ